MTIAGALLLALGLAMTTRGWIYVLRPEGAIATKRKKKNLKYGFPTDMRAFGRKVRRLGAILALLGAFLVGWALSDPEAARTGGLPRAPAAVRGAAAARRRRASCYPRPSRSPKEPRAR